MNVNYANTYIDSILKDKRSVIPSFIIKYGPPGSGKSTITSDLIRKLKIPKNTLVDVNVDDIIHSNKKFEEDIAKASSASERQSIYQKYRKPADVISDTLLNTCLINKYNISWETTGNTISWTVREIDRIRKNGYNIILIYPYTTNRNIFERIKKRSQVSANNAQIKRIAVSAQKNINRLIDYVDELYVYDNNSAKPYLLFSIRNRYNWNKEDKTRLVEVKCNKQKYCSQRTSLPRELVKLMKQCEC